ncbi:MAG: hypothetical protein Q8M22_19440 [Actinomycetota bacterium]|nr:hypothetical protein [Actinomycetota bacterium]
MASAMVKWQLKRVGARLRTLRAELAVMDEQRPYLADDADDLDLRAVVSDSDRDRYQARSAGGHVSAMEAARTKAVDEIRRLEARQDQLLDRLTGG